MPTTRACAKRLARSSMAKQGLGWKRRRRRSERAGGTMSLEQNVAVARRFYECFNANDIDGVMATLGEDARFRVPGKKDEFSSAGWYDKAHIRRLFEFMMSRLKNGLRMEVQSVMADGNRVAL